jgi:hypothetical protein
MSTVREWQPPVYEAPKKRFTAEDDKVLEQWFTTPRADAPAGYAPYDANLQAIIAYHEEHQTLPMTLDTINRAIHSSEVQAQHLVLTKLPSPANFREIALQFLKKRVPTALKANANGLGDELGGQLAKLIERDYNNIYSIENLDAAFSTLRPDSADLRARERAERILAKEQEERVAQSKVNTNRHEYTDAKVREAQSVLTAVEQAKQAEGKRIAESEAVNFRAFLSDGRIDHSKTDRVRKELGETYVPSKLKPDWAATAAMRKHLADNARKSKH